MLNDVTLTDFAKNFQQEVLASADNEESPGFRTDKFTEAFLDYLTEMGEINDGTVCSYYGRGMQVNGYAISEDNDCLHIFVSKYTSEVPPANISVSDINETISRASRFVKRCLDGMYKDLEEATPTFDLAYNVFDIRNQLTSVRIYFLTDGLTNVKKNKICKQF